MKQHTGKLSCWKLCLCVVLIAALALTTAACGNAPTTSETPATSELSSAAENFATSEPASTVETLIDGSTAGEGKTAFTLEVVDGDGKTVIATINTDEKTVGAALQALGIIEGEEGQYGLYIKKVNGITADYDVDGTYWAFYVDGEYAMTGVDKTDIDPSAVYTLKVEKG